LELLLHLVVAMAIQSALAFDEMGSCGIDTLYGCSMAYPVTMIIAIATPNFNCVPRRNNDTGSLI
jgi:hypothetical protein